MRGLWARQTSNTTVFHWQWLREAKLCLRMDIAQLTNRSTCMMQQTVNWVLKLPVQDEKNTSHTRQRTNPLRTIPPSSNAFKDFHRLSFFYRMLYGWEWLQQPLRGRYKILEVSTNYHIAWLIQKKCSHVATIKSNVSCCIPDARTSINDHGASVSEGRYFVGYGTKRTWHKESTRIPQIPFSVKRWGTTDRSHNYQHDTSC